MISRFLLAAGLAVLMVISGFGSYLYLGTRQSKLATPPQKPIAASPRAQAYVLPGTLYLAQSGALYSLSAGRFHQLTPEDGWMQPYLYPDGSSLLAVKRSGYHSDVFSLSRFGAVQAQLTNNAAGPRSYDTADNHWSFYPRLTPDMRTLFMSYDEPKYGFDVNMSVWSMPVGGNIRQARLWTYSNDYTGGDVEPIPLSNGAVLYTKYDYGDPPDNKLIAQLWITTRAGTYGRALTSINDDCLEPALSPNGRELAMICTHEKQISHLVIAPFDGANIGPLQEVITDQLVAQPTWAPDGSGIAYLAPAEANGPFQLWFLRKDAYHPPVPTPMPSPTPTPGTHLERSPRPVLYYPPVVVKPIQVTSFLGFDASSPLAWSN